MSNDNDGITVLDTPEQIAGYMLLSIRRTLKLEIDTGMRFSTRVNVANQARAVTGCASRNKRTVYAALDKKIVAELHMPSVPLRPAKKP
jgi:hypothetical protein